MKTIKFFRYVIMCVFILIGLQYSNAQENDIMQGSPERDYCYGGDVYAGYGTISGAGKVYMVIEIVGDYISGKYYIWNEITKKYELSQEDFNSSKTYYELDNRHFIDFYNNE